jgi:hypothetical protein
VLVRATPRTLRDAEELGFPGVLESAVEAAIGEGRQFKVVGARERLVDVDGWVIRVRTEDRTSQGTRKLLATRIERPPVRATNEQTKRRT